MNLSNQPDEPSKLVTIPAAAKRLGLHPRTLSLHVKSGDIPAHQIGTRFLINLDEALAATRFTPSPAPVISASNGAAVEVDSSKRDPKPELSTAEQVRQQAMEKLREDGPAPKCGICWQPIFKRGFVLSEVESEKDKATYVEPAWFVHSDCYYGGWASAKAHQGLHYSPTDLTPLLQQLEAEENRGNA